jgi:hypothetical protein
VLLVGGLLADAEDFGDLLPQPTERARVLHLERLQEEASRLPDRARVVKSRILSGASRSF